MRKFLLVGALFLAFNFTNAQENVIKVNPIGLAFGAANAGYEFTTADSQTATISGLYFSVDDISGGGLGAEYRFYFTGEAVNGWHAGPSLGYFSLSDDNESASIFSIGAETGRQWIIGEHFALDLFAGYGFLIGADNLSGLSASAASFGISIGYAW